MQMLDGSDEVSERVLLGEESAVQEPLPSLVRAAPHACNGSHPASVYQRENLGVEVGI
jgi:hypothetical protein